MHHHINHCWCSESAHNHNTYYAPNMVDINSLKEDKEDWDNIIEVKRVISEEDLKMYHEFAADKPDLYKYMPAETMSEKDCPCLKGGVTTWLNENIKPQKGGEPGWAVGDDQYRLIQSYKIVLWFQRRNDAKKFIRTFSKYKKRTSYYNHFDDTNLVLDIDTGKYSNRHDS